MSVWYKVSLAMNCLLIIGGFAWYFRGGVTFAAPWDGPAVATLALTTATLVLAAVAVMAGLLAIWGFTTIREHASNIAKDAARDAMGSAANAAAERVVKEWLGLTDGDSSNEIAKTYGSEADAN
jgi:hypothetical protein